MKMKNALIVSLLSVSIFGVSSQSTFASGDSTLLNLNNASEETEIRPYVNWSGPAYLTTKAYSNVTSSNNFFSDRPTVTNYGSNAGSISVRIVNSKGEIVGSTYTIAPGKSKKLDSIPFNSGTYTLQAKAVDKDTDGNYTIGID